MKALIFFIFYISAYDLHAACLSPSASNFVTGKFKIIKISPVEVKCPLKKPEKYIGRSAIAPGCFLEVQQILDSKKTGAKNYTVYGGDGSCGFKVGQIIRRKISNFCCTDEITGCYESEPPHSNAIWGCTFRAWYIYKPNEGKLFPNDFFLRQHIFE